MQLVHWHNEPENPRMTTTSGPGPSDEQQRRGTPIWVKLIVLALMTLVVVLFVAFVAGGEHGPGRHT